MVQSQQSKPAVAWSRNIKWVRLSLLGIGVFAIALLGSISPSSTLESRYAITGKAPFNQTEFYPIQQTLPAHYRPIAPWMGRLILPSPQQQGNTDWGWIEVTHAPVAKGLIGKQVRLEWSQNPIVQRDVAIGTVDVKFSPLVQELRRTKADLYTERLNGRDRVGPLQAMAGARPKDDVTVTLTDATLTWQGDKPVVQIASEPMLETGRYYTLVKIIGQVANAKPEFLPKACPGVNPCASELVRVQHYNRVSRQFDGLQETVRIPQQPSDGNGVYSSTPQRLERSPAGEAGWYLYGAQDKTGLFTVQAIKPRALFQLQPQQVILNTGQALDYINTRNWKDTEQRKGTLQTVLIDPKAQTASEAIAAWQEGRTLVMHLFGGRGGKSGESPIAGTVTGHFAYGVATVVREPLADELQLDIHYYQVYANNTEGIIAGENSWTNYMGNLQRGWLGTRPVTDVIVKLDTLEDYDFGGNRLSPMTEFTRQLRIISDRYRTGDGTGISSVTAATSCVQDSNQALFVTIQSLRHQVEASPQIQQWRSSHPTAPTVKRFERLVALGSALERELTPLGIVRSDWRSNANALSGTQIQQPNFTRVAADSPRNLLAALTTWRTALPRQAQDELSTLFLRHDAQLWFLKTNQVGGNNPDIVPLAPTSIFAAWTIPGTAIPIVNILFARVLGAIYLPSGWEWVKALGIWAGYGAIALPLGFSWRFLQMQPWQASWWRYLLLSLRSFFLPALWEELVFRVLLLPAPRAAVTNQTWSVWALLSLVLFIAYHPLNATTFFPPGRPTFLQPVFLTLTGLLGVACTFAYWLTHSLLIITLIHWSVVVIWLIFLGGLGQLHPGSASSSKVVSSSG